MRILFLSTQYYPTIGGIQTNSEYLIEHFIRNKNEVILMTKTKMTIAEKNIFNFEIYDNPSRKKINELHEWADIIYHNNITLSLSSLKLKHFKKTIVTSQYWLDKENTFRYLMQKLFLILSVQNVFISKCIKKDINLSGEIIPNFYNEKLFFSMKSSSKKQKKILFVGRMTDEKGVDILIKAVKKIEKNLRNGDVSIIGPGNELNTYKKLAKELKIFHLFNFLKKKNKELNKYYNSHKIHVVPSKKEPFGIVTLEGCAAGCIGILSNMYGLSEFDKRIFQFYNNNNHTELAKVIKKNMITPKTINYHIRKKYLSKYNLKTIGDKYLKTFTKIDKKNNV